MFLVSISGLLNERAPARQLETLKELHTLLRDKGDCLQVYALEAGADRKLAWKLSYELQAPHQLDPETAALLCESIVILLKGELRVESMEHLVDYLPWFVQTWKSFVCSIRVVESVLSLLNACAKVKDVTIKTQLIHSGIVEQMQMSLIRPCSYQAKVWNLAKNLSFRASDADKNCLHRTLNHNLHLKDGVDMAVIESMLAFVWNLAVQRNIGKTLGRSQSFWVLMRRAAHIQIDSTSMALHRHSVSILGTVVAGSLSDIDDDTQHRGDTRYDSIALLEGQDWLVPHMIRLLHTTTDSDLRRRTVRLIRCLASYDWGRNFIWKHAASAVEFMTVLVQVLQNADDGRDTRIQACQTIGILLPFASEDDWAFLCPCLERILVSMVEDSKTDDKLRLCACRTLHTSLKSSPWERGCNSFSASFLERLHVCLQSNVTDPIFHEGISELLLRIVLDATSGKGQSLTLVAETTHIMDIIELLVGAVGPDFQAARRTAVEIVCSLSSCDECKKPMADHQRLLSSLVNFCLVTSGTEKVKVKQVILALVPEL